MVIAVVMSAVTLPAYAADSNIKCSMAGDVYTISGTSDEEYINVILMPADENADELTADKLENDGYIPLTIPNKSGKFSKSVKLSDSFPSGEYKTVFRNGEENTELYFMYGSEEYKNELISKKIKEGSLDETVERYGESYGIDISLYKRQKDSVKSETAKTLSSAVITDFGSQFKEALLNAAFGQLKDTEELSDILKMQDYDFSSYNKLTDAQKEGVLLSTLKNLPARVADLPKTVDDYCKAAQNTKDNTDNPSSGGGSSSKSVGKYTYDPNNDNPSQVKPDKVTSLTDISGHWAYESIADLFGRGVISGDENKKFYPDNNITRAEFCKMTAIVSGKTSASNTAASFSDVNRGAWYYNYVMAAAENGLINGYEDGSFRPDNNISRQEMAVIISRMIHAENIAVEDGNSISFTDIADVNDYARDAVMELSGMGIISGDGGSFRPNDNLTKAEASTVLYKSRKYAERMKNGAASDNNSTGTTEGKIVKKQLTKSEAMAAEGKQLAEKLLKRPLRGVTRAGFISDVYALTGMIGIKKSKSSFSDLPISRTESADIEGAAETGIISKGGQFRPDDIITGEEALNAALRALGYGKYIDALSLYEVARKTDMLSGISNISKDGIDEHTAEIILLNMLNAKTVRVVGIENGDITLGSDGKILIEESYKISKDTGFLTQTTLNSLSKTGIDKQDSIVVGGKKYPVSDGDENDYLSFLGNEVDVYYNNENEIVLVAKTEKNQTVTFPSDNAEMNDNYTLSFYNEDSDKEQKFKLSNDYSFIYNDAQSSKSPQAILGNITDGRVELLDNNNDGRYEVFKIYKPEYLFVKSKSRMNRQIFDKNSSENILDMYDDDINIHIEGRDGQQMRFLDISDGEVYETYSTEDKKLVSLKLMKNNISGKITEKGEDGYTIDGKKYKATEYFDKYYADIVEQGKNYTFTISADGKLIAFSDAENKMKLGYISSVAWNDGFNDKLLIKMFTADNRFEVFTVDQKVTADEKTITASEVYDKIVTDGQVKTQLVGYDADDNKKLRSIDFAEVVKNTEPGIQKAEGDSLREYKFDVSSFYFKDNVNLMYPSFNVTGTKVFVIPNDINDKDVFRVTDYSYFGDGQSYSNIRVYNLSESGSAEAVVVRSDTSTPALSKYTSSMVVESVASAINDDGDILKSVSGWMDKKYCTYFIDEKVSTVKASGEELGFGDIVRFYADSDTIKNMVIDFDANENVFAKNNITEAADFNAGNRDFVYQSGRVYSVANSYLYIGGGDDGEDMSASAIRNFAANTDKIAIVDMNSRTIRTGEISDIRTYKNSGTGDYVLIRQRNLFTAAIFVYVR